MMLTCCHLSTWDTKRASTAAWAVSARGVRANKDGKPSGGVHLKMALDAHGWKRATHGDDHALCMDFSCTEIVCSSMQDRPVPPACIQTYATELIVIQIAEIRDCCRVSYLRNGH